MMHTPPYDIANEIRIRNIIYTAWLDEIKRCGTDDKGRVRNPLCIGRRINTRSKQGIYSKLYNWCIDNLVGYDFRGIPIPESTKRSRVINLILDINISNVAYVAWLDEIKRRGADDKGRVRNPLNMGKYISIYTKDGIYPKLYKWCKDNLPDYDFRGVPIPLKKYTSRSTAF
jgi:hypothetical protein